MEQADIDKLLICRQAIDDHRARKQEARDIHAEAVATGFVTRKIGKSGSLSTTFETVPIDAVTAYSNMQTALTESKDEYMAVLVDNGFGSVDAFYSFNASMCMIALKETLVLLTGCDRCMGLYTTAAETPCIKTDGCPDYFDHWEDTKEWQDKLYELILHIWRNLTVNEDGTFTKLLPALPVKESGDFNKGGFSICPDGHGFTFRFNGMPSFDIGWK